MNINRKKRQHLMDAWKQCEEVAMHFNNLLQGFRLKAIGGISLGAAITVGLKLCDSCDSKDHLIISWFFFGLAVVWALVGILDFCYYHRLLAGAVDELLRLEQELGDVFLSHQIEHRVSHSYPANGANPGTDLSFLHGRSAPATFPSTPIRFFYVVPFLLLIFAGWMIGSGHCCTANRQNADKKSCVRELDTEPVKAPDTVPDVLR